AAVIGGTDSGLVKEDTTLTTGGTLTASDVDGTDNTFTPSTQAGTYGTLSLGANGTWSYSLDNGAAHVQALAEGETHTETFTVTAADGTEHVITVEVVGTNEAAVIGGTDSGLVKEDSTLTTGGTLTATDVDGTDNAFTPSTQAGTYGTLSLDANGTWSYSLDNGAAHVQALAEGETHTETFTVTAADGTEHVITVEVVGTNEAAVIGGTDSGLVKEDTTLTTGGTLTATDVDGTNNAFTPSTQAGTYGTLSLGANSTWSYSLDNGAAHVQALAEGETHTETFTVTAADGTEHVITVEVVGTNEAAVIGGTDSGLVKEDTTLTTGGTLTATDVDGTDNAFTPSTQAGTYGTLNLGANGAWSYSLDNGAAHVQALAEGETHTETFTVTAADGTEHVITVEVVGTNEAAVIGGTDSGLVKEDSTLTTGGTLTATDVDGTNNAFTPSTQAGTYGTLSLGANGTWSYSLDNGAAHVQALAEGETHTETFTVTAADGTEHVITVEVVGTNEAAVIGGTDSGLVKEDTTLTTGGTLTASDVDGTNNAFTPSTQAGTYGTLSLGANGTWSYSLDNGAAHVQALAEGETHTETFTVTAADGTEHVITVEVVGTNEAAVIGGTDSGLVKEDTTLTTGGTLTATDVDGTNNAFTPSTQAGTYGTLSLGANGTWSYSLDNGAAHVQALAEGETHTETFTVTAADGTEHVITVEVVGTN
ncbi:VCBS domain-containing protein, partial [Metapseudomonas furukawaii]|uniref:VCBS domain-containing protein n=1 Tax=Metapseudomonas furukawaii TaxID=1149133 RepID=UPI004046200B